MQDEEIPASQGECPDEDEGAGGCSWPIFGLLVGLFGGFILFTTTYPWLAGGDRTSVVRIAIQDGIVFLCAGGIAYHFRKKSGIAQGLLVAAAILFILNGFCGLGGLR
jgi:hypothetical protein